MNLSVAFDSLCESLRVLRRIAPNMAPLTIAGHSVRCETRGFAVTVGDNDFVYPTAESLLLDLQADVIGTRNTYMITRRR